APSSSGGSRNGTLTSWGAKLEKKQQDLKADHSTLLLHLKHFPPDLKILTCQLAFLQSNGTECCPVNWVDHGGSCYWFSQGGLTWKEANTYCQLENAHLVVINSWDEQKFVAKQIGSFHTWIGLTDKEGSWKWVDGTDYKSSYTNWAFSEPNNWEGHELGGSEDCAEILTDGFWNDNFCHQLNRWACEKRRNATH
ncbi:Asialoglycoprotein receptor 2, partial [Lemmus lemmus]